MCFTRALGLFNYYLVSYIFQLFQFEVYTFSHKNCAFRTTNMIKNVIWLDLKNEQIHTQTYDFNVISVFIC